MDEPQNMPDPRKDVGKPVQDRARSVASTIAHVRSARAGGERLADQAIISAHPDLMPELGHELAKLARIEAAWAAAERSAAGAGESGESGESVLSEVAAELACAVAADLERPALEVPGYTVLREIGHGGQAVVFLAIKLNPGRRVALKVMRDGSLAGEHALARFRREAAVLAKLNHPNIVNVFETGRTADGRHYFTMNYIAGCGLGEYMLARRNNDFDDPGKLLRLFFRICEVVNTAHKANVVHRDLKPANIRIDERGEPHILDFGLARSAFDRTAAGLSTGEANDQTISVTGEFLGSLPWSSPEQVSGDSGRIDVRTDVYSLGVILYQMLTGGRFPYEVVGNIRDVLNNIVTSEPTPPSKVIAADLAKESAHRGLERTHLPAVNDEIEKIVLRALAKHPEDRYPNAGQLAAAIADYLLGRKATGVGDAERTSPQFRKKALWPTAVISGIGALTTIACIVWQTTRR